MKAASIPGWNQIGTYMELALNLLNISAGATCSIVVVLVVVPMLGLIVLAANTHIRSWKSQRDLRRLINKVSQKFHKCHTIFFRIRDLDDSVCGGVP